MKRCLSFHLAKGVPPRGRGERRNFDLWDGDRQINEGDEVIPTVAGVVENSSVQDRGDGAAGGRYPDLVEARGGAGVVEVRKRLGSRMPYAKGVNSAKCNKLHGKGCFT